MRACCARVVRPRTRRNRSRRRSTSSSAHASTSASPPEHPADMRLVLAAAAVVALAVPIAAQLPSSPTSRIDPETRFEAASIKPSDPSVPPQISMSPGRYNVAGVRLQGIITDALRLPPNRILGLPDWGLRERYAIAAKA